jgi:hypothetical protein
MIFGFAEFNKVITGVSHEFELTRQEDYYSLFRGADLTYADCVEGKIDLTSLLLWVPIAKADGDVDLMLKESKLNSQTSRTIAFFQRRGLMTEVTAGIHDWTWTFSTINYKDRPQFLIVGFQNNFKADQTSNYDLYNHMDITKMSCIVNGIRIPYDSAEADFPNMNLGSFYTNLKDFSANYLQLDSTLHECGIDPVTFRNLRPLFVFDLTKHARDIKAEVVNSRIEVHFAKVTTANIRAYACILNKKELFLQSDGGNVVIR